MLFVMPDRNLYQDTPSSGVVISWGNIEQANFEPRINASPEEGNDCLQTIPSYFEIPCWLFMINHR